MLPYHTRSTPLLHTAHACTLAAQPPSQCLLLSIHSAVSSLVSNQSAARSISQSVSTPCSTGTHLTLNTFVPDSPVSLGMLQDDAQPAQAPAAEDFEAPEARAGKAERAQKQAEAAEKRRQAAELELLLLDEGGLGSAAPAGMQPLEICLQSQGRWAGGRAGCCSQRC